MANEYYPPKPSIVPPQESCQTPQPGWNWPWAQQPGPCTPPPAPDQFCPVPPPALKPIPPIPTVQEGQSLYEAMNVQIARTNACLEQWNAISANCYAAMNACVEAARSNDVYYDENEVKFEEGYDENEGCTYAIIRKRAVDRNNRPIRVKLELAYNNSTNSGITQDIFEMSFIKSANVVMTAVPVTQTTWDGPAMWKGAPIPGTMPEQNTEEENGNDGTENQQTYWVYGFNRQGWLRVFENTVETTTLVQNGMVDVLGSCVPILIDGQMTEQAQAATEQSNIYAIGFNKGTGDVYFFSCGAYDQPGMSGAAVAKLLQGYGCTTAVITSIVPASNQELSGGMLYMGQMCTVPQAGRTPSNLAYWVISKRENFNNRFQKEIADLVQTTGQNAWKTYLLGANIKSFDDRIVSNYQLIAAETARAQAAEGKLQNAITAETTRAEQAETDLQTNINAEENRALLAETELQTNINAEVNRATAEEQKLNQAITEETSRAKTAENTNASNIAAETLRATTKENTIQSSLDDEITKRIAADNDIINAIEQETLARRAADTALQNSIDKVSTDLAGQVQNLAETVNGMTGGQTALPYLKITGGTLAGDVALNTGNTVTLGRSPTTDMEAATKAYVDTAVAAGGGGSSEGGDATKEYVDMQVSTLQTQLNDKLDKAGGTMTGALDMAGLQVQNAVLSSNTGTSLDNGGGGPGKIVNMATPTDSTDGANKQYVDAATEELESKIEQVSQTVEQGFLPSTGGQMTGDLNMLENSVINFYDPEAVAAAMTRRAVSSTGFKPSKIAQQFGITNELLQTAQSTGMQMSTASVADVLDANGISPQAVAGQTLKGSVYNDGDDMVVKSETGQVMLKGTGVNVSDGAGNPVSVTGVDGLTAEGEITASSVMTSGEVSAGSMVSGGTISAQGAITGASATVTGQVGAGSLLVTDGATVGQLNSTGVVNASGLYVPSGNINIQGEGSTVNGLSLNNQRLTLLATPTEATDAATKEYVDGNGFDIRNTWPFVTCPSTTAYMMNFKTNYNTSLTSKPTTFIITRTQILPDYPTFTKSFNATFNTSNNASSMNVRTYNGIPFPVLTNTTTTEVTHTLRLEGNFIVTNPGTADSRYMWPQSVNSITASTKIRSGNYNSYTIVTANDDDKFVLLYLASFYYSDSAARYGYTQPCYLFFES